MKHRFSLSAGLISALTITLILIVPGLRAQNSVRADIPFAFEANHQVLPAGCYQVKLLSSHILALVNCETSKTVGVMVHTVNGYPTIGHSSMVFRISAGEYRLVHVRFAFTNIQSDLSVQPRLESEFARNATGKTAEIAMR